MDSDKDQSPAKEKDAEEEVKQPEELADLASDAPTFESTSPNKRLFVIGGVVAGVIVVTSIGFFVSQRESISQPGKSPEPTTTQTSSPTATPKPAFDRADVTLEILNGSGVVGAAKKLADKLENLGYKILKTANADRSDYKVTELFVSKEIKGKQDLLLEDLKKEVSIASVAGVLTDSTASARIIIGKE